MTATVVAGCLGLALFGGTGCSKDPERSVPAYCEQVKRVKGLDAILATGDPQRIIEQASELRALQQVSPPEVEPSVAIVLSVTDDLARTLGTVRQPDVAADEVFTRRQSELSAIGAAGATMETYTFDNCRLALNDTGARGTATTVPRAGRPATTTGTTIPTPRVTSTTSPKR